MCGSQRPPLLTTLVIAAVTCISLLMSVYLVLIILCIFFLWLCISSTWTHFLALGSLQTLTSADTFDTLPIDLDLVNTNLVFEKRLIGLKTRRSSCLRELQVGRWVLGRRWNQEDPLRQTVNIAMRLYCAFKTHIVVYCAHVSVLQLTRSPFSPVLPGNPMGPLWP